MGRGQRAYLAVICVRVCSAQRAVRSGPNDTAIAGVGKGCSFSSYVVNLFGVAMLRRRAGSETDERAPIYNINIRVLRALSQRAQFEKESYC